MIMKTQNFIEKHDFIDFSQKFNPFWLIMSLFSKDVLIGYDKKQKVWYRKVTGVDCQIIEKKGNIVAHPINHYLIKYDKIL